MNRKTKGALIAVMIMFPTIVPPAFAGSMPGISDMAAAIALAYQKREAPPSIFFADKIEIWHVPTAPGDPAIVTNAQFNAGFVGEFGRLKQVMKDFRFDKISTTLEHDGFIIKVVLVGTPRSGKKFESPMSMRYYVTNGMVTRYDAAEAPEEHAMLVKIMQDLEDGDQLRR